MSDGHVSSTPLASATVAARASLLADPSTLSPDQRAWRRSRLRRLHLEAGIDPGYLSLPDGMRLWFVFVVLDTEIHAGCLGFTRCLHEYALGADEAGAVEAIRRWWQALDVRSCLVRGSVRPSCAEHPEEL